MYASVPVVVVVVAVVVVAVVGRLETVACCNRKDSMSVWAHDYCYLPLPLSLRPLQWWSRCHGQHIAVETGNNRMKIVHVINKYGGMYHKI